MKKILLSMLLAAVAATGWSFDIDYNYSSKQSLLQMGFSDSEMSAGLIQPTYNGNKLLHDNHATMQYEHFLVGEFDAPRYSLFLCTAYDSGIQFGESWPGTVTWTCNTGLAITKVVVESLNSSVAGRVNITTQMGDEVTMVDAIITCNLQGNQNYFKISGASAIIEKITVSYKSIYKYDVTGDGTVDVSDVNAAINIILKNKTAADYPCDADVTGDSNVDVSDVNAIINFILNPDTPEETEEEFEVNGVKFTMVKVEGGTFTMGGTAEHNDAYSEFDEEEWYEEDWREHLDAWLPTHQVTLSSYSIGQTEVTQELWQAVMGSNPSYYSESRYGPGLPVECVSWDNCQEFITKLNQLTGRTFRLPTEAEWEYAARGGNRSRGCKYAGSNSIDDVAWYHGNAYINPRNTDVRSQAVGTKAPNELGLYDMSGNVLEWCQDWYGEYSSAAQTNPTGPETGSNRVLRGGSIGEEAVDCRVPFRCVNFRPSIFYPFIGLRLAL